MKAQPQINKMYNTYNCCASYTDCCFDEKLLLGEELEKSQDAMQLLSSPVQNSKSVCAFQFLFKRKLKISINKFRYQIKEQCFWYQSCLHVSVQGITIIFLIGRILIPSYFVFLIKPPQCLAGHIQQQENKAV